jgi:hypothetical protein
MYLYSFTSGPFDMLIPLSMSEPAEDSLTQQCATLSNSKPIQYI